MRFDVDIDRKQVEESHDGSQIVRQLEGILIGKLISYINKELETKNNLYLTAIAQAISFNYEKLNEKLVLKSRIYIE